MATFSQPRYWKKLERHPMSKEYPDLSPAVRERLRESIKEHGVKERKVTLHEGMVLDGWQFLQACIDEEVRPAFRPVPSGWTPEQWVEAMNDLRRHETQEVAIARASARRERVAAARAAGDSIRTIAALEGVSVGTVATDLKTPPEASDDEISREKQGSGVQGRTPERVAGADGKSYPATKPSAKPKTHEVIPELRACVSPKRLDELRHLDEVSQQVMVAARSQGKSFEASLAEAEGAAKPAERQAGDDTDPVYDWTAFEQGLGILSSVVDGVGAMHKAKGSAEAAAFRARLRSFRNDVRAWEKLLSEGKKESFLPESLDTPEFRKTWGEWVQYRKEKKAPLTATGSAKAIKELAAWGAEKAIKALDTAMAKGWQGFFDPEDKSNGRQGKTPERQNNRYIPKPGEE